MNDEKKPKSDNDKKPTEKLNDTVPIDIKKSVAREAGKNDKPKKP